MTILATDVVPGSSVTVNGVPSYVTSTDGNVVTTAPSEATPTGGKAGQILTSLGNAAPPTYQNNAASGNTTSATLTANTVPKATGAAALANSSITDNGTTVTVGEPLSIASAAPATAGAAGVAGTITWANGFLYVCVATNTWQRVAIATF